MFASSASRSRLISLLVQVTTVDRTIFYRDGKGYRSIELIGDEDEEAKAGVAKSRKRSK